MSGIDCKIYDLVEYKLKKYIDSFYQGSEEWSTGMHVLLMYMDGEVYIQWCSEGMVISHPSVKKMKEHDEQRSIVLTASGSIGGL